MMSALPRRYCPAWEHGIKNRLLGPFRLMLPMFTLAVRKGERVALAMDSRGLGARPTRTFYKRTAITRIDLLFAGVVLVFCAATILVLGHYGLGKAYLYVDGRLDDAVIELKKAVECDRSFSKAHFYLGMAYMFRKDYASAIDSFHQAYLVDRTCIEALYNMGAIFDFMGHPFKSKRYFGEYRAAKQGDNEPF